MLPARMCPGVSPLYGLLDLGPQQVTWHQAALHRRATTRAPHRCLVAH